MTDLARRLGYVAGDLDRRQYPYAGVVRQAARALLALDDHDADDSARCPECGNPVEQPERGRPRIYDTDRCRWRASAKRHRNATVAMTDEGSTTWPTG